MGHVLLTGSDHATTASVGSFLANLPEMLGSMAVDPRRLVAVVEFEDGRYVQFWVEPQGLVIAEVISNLNIGDARALSNADEACLRSMGWSEPSPGPNPNWRFEATDVAGLVDLVAMTARAVVEVLGEVATARVSLRTWAMQRESDDESGAVREVARVYYQSSLRDLQRQLDGP
ncbi:MAG: hypothetical protein ABSC34_06045 [Acidimicrobiales bacterium]